MANFEIIAKTQQNFDDFCWNIEAWAVQKHVNLIDLVMGFLTSMYLWKSASMKPRTSPPKFGKCLLVFKHLRAKCRTNVFSQRKIHFRSEPRTRVPWSETPSPQAARNGSPPVLPSISLVRNLSGIHCARWPMTGSKLSIPTPYLSFFLFFGRMRLKKHSEKTDDARPNREQDQRKRGRASSDTRKSSALSHLN